MSGGETSGPHAENAHTNNMPPTFYIRELYEPQLDTDKYVDVPCDPLANDYYTKTRVSQLATTRLRCDQRHLLRDQDWIVT